MLAAPLVIGVSSAYLLLLFAVAHLADRRAVEGRSVIGNAWVYTLSMGVYCTAWTYFGSVGRAATSGLWFLPIYLGPTLAMMLAWVVLRKMIRIARTHRITSIADFIASRYGKSPTLAGLATLIAMIGVVPYIALQLKAVAGGYALLTGGGGGAGGPWWSDSTLYVALALAAFTIAFGTRHLDATERHEGMVAAIALESVVKLLAFLAVGAFVVWGLYDGPGDIFAARARAPRAAAPARSSTPAAATPARSGSRSPCCRCCRWCSCRASSRSWWSRTSTSATSSAPTWAFPLYLLLDQPVRAADRLRRAAALRGAKHRPGDLRALAAAGRRPRRRWRCWPSSAACRRPPAWWSSRRSPSRPWSPTTWSCRCCCARAPSAPASAATARELGGVLLAIRRVGIVALLLLGYLYFRIAGEAYALVSIGLISFAAVAQFAPALLAGMYWKGGTRAGALRRAARRLRAAGSGCCCCRRWRARAGSTTPSCATGRSASRCSGPSSFLGLAGLDNLTHSLFWSLLANVGALRRRVAVARAVGARGEPGAALRRRVRARRRRLPTPARRCSGAARRKVADLRALAARLLGARRARRRCSPTTRGARGAAERRRHRAPTRGSCSTSRRSSPAPSAAPRRARWSPRWSRRRRSASRT